jgi:hypothetical protein
MRNITIDRSKFFDCDIAGIVVIPGSGLTGSVRNDQFETLKIRGCDIDGNSVTDNGINIGNWIDVLIEGGTIQHTETGGILIRSCKDVKVRGVTVTDVTLAGTGATYGVQVDSTLTVNSAAISVHGCKISTIDGYGIHYIDTDTGSIVDNIIDDCDNDSQARDNIRVVQSTLVCRRVSVIGNVSTNSALGSGIRFHNSGVTDCIVSGNICLGNGAANQIADVGTNTHHGLNVTGSFSGHTTTNFMSVPNAGAPPGGGGSAWAGIFTAASAVATTLVSNNNIRSTNAIVHLTPRSLAAANNVSAWHITAISAGSFKLKHRATAGQVFLYSILNRG